MGTPPTGHIKPLTEISPVIATVLSTGIPRIADQMAVAIPAPAEGPSTGIPPGKLR